MTEEFEYRNLIRLLNEEQRQIFYDIMYRKNHTLIRPKNKIDGGCWN